MSLERRQSTSYPTKKNLVVSHALLCIDDIDFGRVFEYFFIVIKTALIPALLDQRVYPGEIVSYMQFLIKSFALVNLLLTQTRVRCQLFLS